uniref:Exocyst subunit Exo70 family protein n=1 Tax=Davidia involucrata TaxID=16924 RepID=A0A5B7ACL4_DAVIN
MKYIIRISVYKQTLVELLESKTSMDFRYSDDLKIPDMKFMELGEQTRLALHLIRILVTLQFKLEEKSKQYEDTALSHLFMMNNVHYIVQKIEGCPELKKMIGGDYLKQLTGIFRQAAISYQRSTLASVLNCLRDEGMSYTTTSWSSAERERLKSFNALFKKVHETQAAWSVPDLQLREELRISISLKLILGYRTFLGRCSDAILNRYVKYTADDLETAVLDFFERNPVSQHSRNRSDFRTD